MDKIMQEFKEACGNCDLVYPEFMHDALPQWLSTEAILYLDEQKDFFVLNNGHKVYNTISVINILKIIRGVKNG